MATTLPPFSLEHPLYDQSVLSGRITHFFKVFDPLLLSTSDEELTNARSLLKQFGNGAIKNDSQEMRARLWHSRKLVEAIVHPQTNEKVFLPFRFSAFVPINIPIVVGMLTTTSPMGQMFWQWINQSYNVCVNYANGNKTNPLPPRKIATAYVGAVGMSCGLAYALGKVADRATRLPPVAAATARVFVPYTAVAAAGAGNALMMRYNEMTEGINVEDEDGNVVGVSKLAGKKALQQVAITRVVLPAPIILLPGLIMKGVEQLSIVRRMPRIKLPINVCVATGVLWAALPFAIGLFPQTASAHVNELEQEFRSLKRSDGSKIERLFFNKGL